MFKPVWILAAVVASAAPGATLAEQHARPSQAAPAARAVRVPPGARIVATAEIDRVHAFPEQKGKAPPEAVSGVHAVDRVYQVARPYRDIVAFFDRQATERGIMEVGRDVTQTSTAWALVLTPGRVANVIVRNTQPTTIEIVSATGVAEIPARPGAASDH
jgi:hypothetical protein